MEILTGATKKNTNKGSGPQVHTPPPALSVCLSGKDLTHTVIILQWSSDKISKYVEQTS